MQATMWLVAQASCLLILSSVPQSAAATLKTATNDKNLLRAQVAKGDDNEDDIRRWREYADSPTVLNDDGIETQGQDAPSVGDEDDQSDAIDFAGLDNHVVIEEGDDNEDEED
mmetsp:Transcript_119812/g.238577  ORF Transcript_119812/g.238577 Transcript_119812/m.238577 type:complete len:113 (-) Transcript_119812:87-425(-)